VALALGSLWHAPSTARSGEAPRLAMLFEYTPSFVKPRDRSTDDFIRRFVPPPDQGIFPRLPPPLAPLPPAPLPPPLSPPLSPLGKASQGKASQGKASHSDTPSPPSSPAAPSPPPLATPLVHCGPSDIISAYEWPALVRERPSCITIRTRVVLRGGGPAVPIFGLGTGSPDDDPAVIAAAIRAGYSLIDTGQLYDNDLVIRDAISASGVHRESLVLTSKAGSWCDGQMPTALQQALPAQYRGAECASAVRNRRAPPSLQPYSGGAPAISTSTCYTGPCHTPRMHSTIAATPPCASTRGASWQRCVVRGFSELSA